MKLNKKQLIVLVICFLFLGGVIIIVNQEKISDYTNMKAENNDFHIELPAPVLRGEMSLEEAIARRRSVRDYKDEAMTLAEVSQLLWSVQGITDPDRGFRTVPSAGALYPLSIYIAAGNVENLEPGVYQYLVEEHGLVFIKKGDIREELYQNALYQSWVKNAPLVMIIAADYNITAIKYGERAERYVNMEVGHAAQNVYLQATALGLGTVVVGAFDEKGVKTVSGLQEQKTPLYLLPIGR